MFIVYQCAIVAAVPCLCQTCPQFLIPSGFQSWTGCLRRRAGRAGPWVLRYRGWGLRPPSCWVNRWGPRATRRCSWSRWGDSLSSDLDTRGQMAKSEKSAIERMLSEANPQENRNKVEPGLFHERHRYVHAHKQHASRQPRQSWAPAEAPLPVKSRCSVLLLIPRSKSAIHREERGN